MSVFQYETWGYELKLLGLRVPLSQSTTIKYGPGSRIEKFGFHC